MVRGQRPAHETDPVGEADPRHVLPSGADRTASEQSKRQRQLRQRSAVSREHEAAPQQHDARPRRGLERTRLPVAAHVRQEVGARRRLLGDDLVAVDAVDPDRGAADEDGGRTRRGRDRGHQRAGGRDAAARGSPACARRSSARPAMDSPARLITASARSSACRQVVSFGRVDQRTSPSRCGRRVRIDHAVAAAREVPWRARCRESRCRRQSERSCEWSLGRAGLSLTRPGRPIY